jgi:hypothetical protein
VLFGFLSPYLSNPDTLERFGLAVLVPDAVVVARIQRDPWADRMLRTLLQAHRHAANVDERAAFAAYKDWQAEVQRGLSHWWSGYYLESDKSRLALFVLDNAERIAPYLPETELRPEHGIVCLASAMATQGFEMVDFRVEQGSVRVVVRDVTDGEPKRRMLHASQFVCPVCPCGCGRHPTVEGLGLARRRSRASCAWTMAGPPRP